MKNKFWVFIFHLLDCLISQIFQVKILLKKIKLVHPHFFSRGIFFSQKRRALLSPLVTLFSNNRRKNSHKASLRYLSPFPPLFLLYKFILNLYTHAYIDLIWSDQILGFYYWIWFFFFSFSFLNLSYAYLQLHLVLVYALRLFDILPHRNQNYIYTYMHI